MGVQPLLHECFLKPRPDTPPQLERLISRGSFRRIVPCHNISQWHEQFEARVSLQDLVSISGQARIRLATHVEENTAEDIADKVDIEFVRVIRYPVARG